MIAATILAVALNSTIVANRDSRCNDIHTNAIQGELQNFAQHPAGPSGREQRNVALVQAQTDAQTERVILAGVCSEDDYKPIAARLYTLDAWADVLGEQNNESASLTACPDANKKVKAAATASAWVKLAQAASAPTPPALMKTVTPEVQALAAQAGVTLPNFPEATQYWETQYETAAKAAIVDCASPAPSASPHA